MQKNFVGFKFLPVTANLNQKNQMKKQVYIVLSIRELTALVREAKKASHPHVKRGGRIDCVILRSTVVDTQTERLQIRTTDMTIEPVTPSASYTAPIQLPL